MAEYGIKITSDGNDSRDESLETFQFQALSSRNSLTEKSSTVTSSSVTHGVGGGIPLVLNFQIVNSSKAKALGSVSVDGTEDAISFNRYNRVFYNKQSV